jgi:alpha-ketoglutarate-dependent taurine dioxygenase
MTELGQRIGRLSGRPKASGLHVHPLTEDTPELGSGVVAEISSDKQKKGGGLRHAFDDKSTLASTGWHSDITFENNPSDYAALRIHTLPETGGDTLWGSAYEAYDRISPKLAEFLETLTATHDANFFHDEARRLGIPIKAAGRGHPMNQGEDLRAVHPVIRTNREFLVMVLISALLASLTDHATSSYYRLEGLIRQLRFHQANQRRHS